MTVALIATWALPPARAGAAPGPTPYLDSVAATLRARAPGTENRIWWFSRGNTLPTGWLLQTPDCWGAANCGPPSPGGRRFLHALTAMIANARRSVDIAELYPPPGGGFEAAIVAGLRQALKHESLAVRILIGTYPSSYVVSFFHGRYISPDAYASQLLKAVTTGLAAPHPRLTLNVAYAETSFLVKRFVAVADSWNHEKVVDVDGRLAVVGGMNYWSYDYLDPPDPVSDVSMQVSGPAAVDVSHFTNVLWSWACSHNRRPEVTLATRNGGCIVHLGTTAAPPVPGGVPIIVVGHLGNGIGVPGEANRESPPIPPAPLSGNKCSLLASSTQSNNSRSYEYRNPGEDALRALIAGAKRSVFISQQDLLSCLPKPLFATEAKFDDRLLAILGTKIAQKVPIRIVVSPKATADYSNGWTLKEVAVVLKEVVAKQRHISVAQARLAVCSDVGLTTLHSFAAATWPRGKAFRNHAKVVAVDDQAFYIGSQNLYPARLQELGLIAEDPKASADLKSAYIDPIWKYSSPYALIDPPSKCGDF